MKLIASVALAMLVAAPASATTLRVTLENLQPSSDGMAGGFALTPLYAAFHDGHFDAFTEGDAASAGVERIAELGDASGLPAERTAASPGSQATMLGSDNGMGGIRPVFAGETASVDIDIADPATNRFFTFLSMIIPTNDIFIGNDDQMAYSVFDAMGNFNGPLTINVTGEHVYDAGTEVNDPLNGAPFVANGSDPLGGAVEGGLITEGYDALSAYIGTQAAPGFTISTDLPDSAAQFGLARISITEVAAIPLPAGAVLMLSALGLAGAVSRRARS